MVKGRFEYERKPTLGNYPGNFRDETQLNKN